MIKKVIRKIIRLRKAKPVETAEDKLYKLFKGYTMIHEEDFKKNLEISRLVEQVEGSVVECGVWRGGMIAAIAMILGAKRHYYLCDSFEGLPLVEEIDGEEAAKWQSDTTSQYYYDNCKAEIHYAQEAMQLGLLNQTDNVHIIQGWFENTLPTVQFNNGIALLRLDADWYKSTMFCMSTLYKQVVKGGIIIIDDYYSWEGCSKAVHDYLSTNQLATRIYQYKNRVAFLKVI